ncbi:MAG: TonB-dependent siderophore receptor [Thalassobius sp.]|nr:TonB-dependent siderophore receptor [Thalassovita sp.]
MKLYLLTGLAYLLTLIAVNAQSGKVKGNITTSDGEPAEYVNVGLKGTTKGSTTNYEGNYEIENVAVGNYTLIASFVGLETQESQIEVKAGETISINFTLNESAQELSEVVVQANANQYNEEAPSPSLRLNAPLIETPQNIQVVTKAVLEDQQVISMSDGLIRNVSGAVRTEHWGDLYTNIKVRGSQIQAFRNGFNVVNSSWGPLTEDMSFVDHIEFVKGPAGFMLANGDPSGLYNVVTKKPTGVTKGEVSFTVGSFDLYRSTLDLDGKLSKDGKLLYRLNLAAQNKKSHRDNEFNNRYVIAPVISYQLDKNSKLTLEYTYQRAEMSDVGSYYVFSPDGFATYPVEFTTLPSGMPATNIDDHSFFVNFQHKLNNNWKLTGQLAYFNYQQQGSSMWPGAVYEDGKILRAVSSWDAKSKMTLGQVFVNGDVTTGSVRHRILGGLDLGNKEYFADWGQYHMLDSVGAEFDPLNPYYGVPVNGYPQFDYSTPLEERAQAVAGLIDQRYTGVYVQDELGFINNKVRLTLAGRYTSVSQSSYGGTPLTAKRFTPRVGLSVSLNDFTSVYALYDQAFIPQAGVLTSGDDAKPITGNNMEIGFKRDWAGGKWSSTLGIYRILKNNEITSDPDNPNSGLSVELGEKRSQGIEFDLRGTIVNGLKLIANYAYTDSKVTKVTEGITDIDEGDIIPGFAKHTVNGWLTYKIQSGVLKGTGFSAGVTYLADRQTYWDESPDPSQSLPDYVKVDAGLFWQKDRIKITANVFNVLDEYLYSGSYYSWLSAYYWQTDPPRNARLSLNYKF